MKDFFFKKKSKLFIVISKNGILIRDVIILIVGRYY